MRDKATRILNVVDMYSNLDDIYGEIREELINCIIGILEEKEDSSSTKTCINCNKEVEYTKHVIDDEDFLANCDECIIDMI